MRAYEKETEKERERRRNGRQKREIEVTHIVKVAE